LQITKRFLAIRSTFIRLGKIFEYRAADSNSDMSGRWKVVDFFSGSGGMSWGFSQDPRFEIIAAVDYEIGKPGRTKGKPKRINCNATYERNIGIKPICMDLSTADASDLRERIGIGKGELSVMIACPPCTGFSQKNAANHIVDDPRNALVERVADFVEEFDPEFLVMENVKELISGKMSHHYETLRRRLIGLGYNVRGEIHDLSDFGLPQRRTRALIVARKHDRPIPAIEPPVETPRRTVRDAIGSLRPLEAGGTDPADPMHRVPAHNEHSMERIMAIPKDGGSWADIPDTESHLLIPAMKRSRKGSFPDIYGRLAWDLPSITVTRECGHPGNGRYLHPEQDRMLSVREMALLQGFPPTYEFEGPMSSKYNQIGDAVPPMISSIVAATIGSLLSGEPSSRTKAVQTSLVLFRRSPEGE